MGWRLSVNFKRIVFRQRLIRIYMFLNNHIVKKSMSVMTLFLMFTFYSFNAEGGKSGYREGEKLRIKTSRTHFRDKPRAFGAKIIKILERGTEVTFISKKGTWLEVNYENEEGFISKNSLIKAKKFKTFSRTAKVTKSDMVAATKGFSPEVERKNRENKRLRYDLMDKAEAQSDVEDPLKSLSQFRQKGKLGEFVQKRLKVKLKKEKSKKTADFFNTDDMDDY